MNNARPYGKELILDLHYCAPATYRTREQIEAFMVTLCDLIDMDREDLHFWDYDGEPEAYAEAPPHLKGTSAVQFIKTSNVTIHTLDDMKRVYLNIFSCKTFNGPMVKAFCEEWFKGTVVNFMELDRV